MQSAKDGILSAANTQALAQVEALKAKVASGAALTQLQAAAMDKLKTFENLRNKFDPAALQRFVKGQIAAGKLGLESLANSGLSMMEQAKARVMLEAENLKKKAAAEVEKIKAQAAAAAEK